MDAFGLKVTSETGVVSIVQGRSRPSIEFTNVFRAESEVRFEHQPSVPRIKHLDDPGVTKDVGLPGFHGPEQGKATSGLKARGQQYEASEGFNSSQHTKMAIATSRCGNRRRCSS